MDIDALRHFLAVADEGGWSEGANAAHVSRATVQASVKALEELRDEQLLVEDESGVTLTAAGIAFRPEARARVAAAPAPAPKAGGKAKASKGRGRAPVVKGQPKPYKNRQGR
ncbi:helix-turn-helix domain-containing protein [Herbiconiux sp. P18]|uniref:helix-turn-helix domain-containing protein n=1 Tax=Herbiconiux liangxiaofengii TaxID=3342795 RepID=UPI0035B72805